MILNYFKTAWRSLVRFKLTISVSLFGLFLGVTCFLLLSTYILNEIRYDRFHDKADRIVAVNMSYKSPADADFVSTTLTPTAVVPVAKREFSEVEEAARIYNYGTREVKVNNVLFTEKDMVIADEGFFRIFSFNFIEGDPGEALKDPYSVVITSSTAKKYFGPGPALGKAIIINEDNWKVSGVIEDIPPYSTLQFNILGSYSSDPRATSEVWNSANDRSYLLLNPASKTQDLQQKIDKYVSSRFSEEFKAGFKFQLQLQPLTQVHLYSVDSNDNNVIYLYILSVIAILLLIIACINFTNLMTAKSSERLREIGVRKVLGAKRVNLIFQFLTESAIVNFIALTLAVIAAHLLLPSFNNFTGLSIGVGTWQEDEFVLFLIFLFTSMTLIAGTW
ncbi:ABC transporter permease [Antarcticibacterium sp. 1MA-6-2]|uniref:ABC transporter permease n=1 Tax=Antarcticibacterium sp. 1MA-6-2 TaxID=2908210 RepID=UPI001F3BAFB7|nr:ABC transporter permease [Antarcticibacterium sp. 1MA-6-2]UJH91005.1 ABC transporter permease [Antarcticibacterium sp. 1MA-6-2]